MSHVSDVSVASPIEMASLFCELKYLNKHVASSQRARDWEARGELAMSSRTKVPNTCSSSLRARNQLASSFHFLNMTVRSASRDWLLYVHIPSTAAYNS